MKRALGYFGMALAGGLLALGLHDQFAPARTAAQNRQNTADAPVKMVSLPVAGGGTVPVPDFTGAAESSVNAVVHVTTEATMQQAPGDGLLLGLPPGAAPRGARVPAAA
jgi:hypothetical protein